MTSTTYTPPTNPADPEAAALEMIVRVPGQVLDPDNQPPLDLLQELALVLQFEGAFTGLSWHDARHAAAAIVVDFLTRDDAVAFLHMRADRARDGSDGMTWDDAAAVSRAMTIGAKVLA